MIAATILVTAIAAASDAIAQSAGTAQSVPVTLSEWKIEATDTVQAGAVTFRITNSGRVSHALYVRGDGVEQGTRDIPAGQSATLRLTLKPGAYDVFCPMAEESHKKAGMSRKLVVKPADAGVPKKP